jgi:hypothetical protein
MQSLFSFKLIQMVILNCKLLFSSLLSVNLKNKTSYILQYYNFDFCFMWVWNLVCHTKLIAQVEGVWEQSA